MSTLEKKIITLLSSPNYQKLAAYEPPFDPFQVINCREKNYSSVLFWLLSDSANSTFRENFVKWVSERLENDISDIVPIVECEFNGKELGKVDLLVHFQHKLAIAIEVKI